ncbi:MAG TPA: GMC family oxidoreductase [Gemmatimonadales bacterium]|nr:GMC family oxidoreductase [Gemmatimonadales bacterium]
MTSFQTRSEVDFVIVGSGAAGGIMAKELSTAGFSVVVLEQGPYLKPQDFRHDELGYFFNGELYGSLTDFPQTFRKTEQEEAHLAPADGLPPAWYARIVGGSSVHFTANFWRFHEIDFIERSRVGSISGTGFADWPITYAELEPYYTKVDWEIGVSGEPGPYDPPRSRPYPMPPLPVKSSGVLFERGARKLGWRPFPAPLAILSRPHNNRPACIHCGFCMGFGCEIGAKSSSLAAMIPLAEATGRCEIRPLSTAMRIETNPAGRVSQVVYVDREGREHAQRARAVVVCGNGAETARLLLMSTSSRFPQGLANSSGTVGKYLMWNGNTGTAGYFEHPLNEFKSVQATRVLHEWYDSDPRRGFYGGGGLDARFQFYPILFGLMGLPPGSPSWGAEYKRMLGQYFNHTMQVAGHSTSLPVESNSISLDPIVKDKWGRPAMRVTYRDHPDDVKMMAFLVDRAREVLQAAGAAKVWDVFPAQEQTAGAHLLGTCRMGNDPRDSVVDRYHRAHDVPNLFICDGSSFVTSGRGQPTMTIMALAFRAAEHITRFARNGEI